MQPTFRNSGKNEKADAASGKEKAPRGDRNHSKKLKFSYKEEREWATIEEDIEALENKLSEYDDEIVKCATDFVKLNELTKEKEETEKLLEEKLERWEYLSNLAEEIEKSKG